MKKIPTLYEWAGGLTVFEKLTTLFYQKVRQDTLLSPVFKHMPPEHEQQVAYFITEVFGGPAQYSSHGGNHYKMVQKHLGKHLSEEHRKRWVQLLLETADEINLPDDPEFRSAFVAYLEWGTRLAVINSHSEENPIITTEPMPQWGWGVPGEPYQL